MNDLKVIVAPDIRLNQISKSINYIEKNISIVLDKMLECMYKNNGIGLAAPQVGILKRLIVIDCSNNKENKRPLKLINPEIISFSDELADYEEGCLSLPAQFAKVTRPNKITLRYRNSKGDKIEKNFIGLEATCIQHEVDHLNGKLFVDHISKLRKNIIIKKLIKYKKKINTHG